MKVVDISIPMPWGNISGRAFGEEQHFPVLCIHGRSDNLETFSNFIPLLPQNLYYVCIDLPGHGKSSHADIGYILDIFWYVLSTKRVIDYFKWTKIYLLGHSFGGYVSFFLSAFYPELVLKLIILDTLVLPKKHITSLAPLLRKSIMELTLKHEKRLNSDEAPIYSLEDFVQKMKDVRLTEVTTEQLERIAERNLIKVGDNMYKYSNDQRVKILGFQLPYDLQYLENIARDICCPILLILGKNSSLTRPLSHDREIVLKVNKNAVIHIIDGDHDVHISRPNEVAQLVVPFLRSETKCKL